MIILTDGINVQSKITVDFIEIKSKISNQDSVVSNKIEGTANLPKTDVS